MQSSATCTKQTLSLFILSGFLSVSLPVIHLAYSFMMIPFFVLSDACASRKGNLEINKALDSVGERVLPTEEKGFSGWRFLLPLENRTDHSHGT